MTALADEFRRVLPWLNRPVRITHTSWTDISHTFVFTARANPHPVDEGTLELWAYYLNSATVGWTEIGYWRTDAWTFSNLEE